MSIDLIDPRITKLAEATRTDDPAQLEKIARELEEVYRDPTAAAVVFARARQKRAEQEEMAEWRRQRKHHG